MPVDLSKIDWAPLRVDAEKAIAFTETALKELAPFESLIVLPDSTKAFLADLPQWLADIDAILEKL
jgi:hypothetical protein